MKKRGLLRLLLDRFPELGKEALYARVLCGEVTVDGSVIKDPKLAVSEEAYIAFTRRRYVSRGGEKLEHPLTVWNIETAGKVWLDAGSSTGGFTDCLLAFGAAAVHAVDVGVNQIDYRLRTDVRVILHEKTNIMNVRELSPVPHLAAADLSFRSIVGAAEHIISLTSMKTLIALVKPQFELKAPSSGFRGVVTESAQRKSVLEDILNRLARRGLTVAAVTPSPIAGRKGNREFFFLIKGSPAGDDFPAGAAAMPSDGLLDGIF